MPQTFDPYHTWLGIPPEKQPPHLYDLLGVPLFEDKPEVIEAAADRQMGHLRTYQTGKHSKLSQKLLNQVASARVCLLNPQKKTDYDQRLRKVLQETRQAAGGKAAGETTTQSTDFNRLGDYQLLEKLGEGGMGAVYKALHTKLGREVAIKVLPPGKLSDKAAIARFEREMMAVGRLDHANIVRAHDAREIDGKHFLVMELVDGMDLKELGRRQFQLSVADVCELIRQAALGLQCAHENKLVHRDIKPSNLMLTADGKVKVLDMGLARFQSEQAGEQLTATEQALGTLDYMAPEQAVDTHGVDIRADIYSLGCTIYKLLTGLAPFEDSGHQTAFEKMNAHVKVPPRPIRKFRGDVPKELLAVVNRMLAKDPARRFATPAKVADAVGPMAAAADLPALYANAKRTPPVTRPSQARLGTTKDPQSSGLTRFLERVKIKPPPPPGMDQPVGSKRPIIIGLAAVALLLMVGIVVLGLTLGDKTPEETAVANPEQPSQKGPENPTPEKEPDDPPEKEPDDPPEKQPEEQSDPPQPDPSNDKDKYDVPSEAEYETAYASLDGFYKIEHTKANGTPKEKLRLAGDLLELGKKEGEKNATQRYVCLWEASILAVGAGDVSWIVQAAAAIGATFKQNADDIKKLRFAEFVKDVSEPPALDSLPDPNDQVLLADAYLARYEQTQTRTLREHAETLYQVAKPILTTAVALKHVDNQLAKIKQAEIDELRGKYLREAEQRFAAAFAPVEAKAGQWDLIGAWKEAGQINFDTALEGLGLEETLQKRLDERLERRRNNVMKMGRLWQKLIEKINADVAAGRPPKTMQLGIPGVVGEVASADKTGITVKSGNRLTLKPWAELSKSSSARKGLLDYAVDPSSPDDWLAASLLAEACKDVGLAEKFLGKAQSTGVKIEPYLEPLAERMFAQADQLLREAENSFKEKDFQLAEKQFTGAADVLASLEPKFGTTSWYASHKETAVSALGNAKSGKAEAQAEQLYTKAVPLYRERKYFDLKPLVEELIADYAETRVVKDTKRDPSCGKMVQVIREVGEHILVRKDGKPDKSGKKVFTTIQAAINAASPGSLIEVVGGGVFQQEIIIPKGKKGLTIRGEANNWPIVKLDMAKTGALNVDTITIKDTEVRLDNMCIVNSAGRGSCLAASTGVLHLRSVILICGPYGRQGGDEVYSHPISAGNVDLDMDSCFALGNLNIKRSVLRARNSLLLGGRPCNITRIDFTNVVVSGLHTAMNDCILKHCTIIRMARLEGKGGKIQDSILQSVFAGADTQISFCSIPKDAYDGGAGPGEGCISKKPVFTNPEVYDYRLVKGSPGKDAAPDGGDIGCQYTPEMLKLLEIVAGLKRSGIIKF